MIDTLKETADAATLVWAGAFIVGLLYGWIAEHSGFCMRAAVAEWTSDRKKQSVVRTAQYVTAMLTSLIAVQLLLAFTAVDFDQSLYRATPLRPVSLMLGGTLFGIGMVLSGGCVSRLLILASTGNLRSLFTLLLLGISGYATLRGILAYARIEFGRMAEISGPARTLDGLLGLSPQLAGAIAAVPMVIFLIFLLRRTDAQHVGAGVGVGLLVAAGWWITGILGADDFEPQRLQSMTFVAPVGEALQYIMTYTGSTLSFGVALIAGVMIGALVSSLRNDRFAIIGFQTDAAPLRYGLGGILMGFGGVIGLGCPTGQGITGTGTLSVGSYLMLISIALSAAATYLIMERRNHNR